MPACVINATLARTRRNPRLQLSLDSSIASSRTASYQARAASVVRGGDVGTGIERLRFEAASALLVIGRVLRQAAVVEHVGRHYCETVGISVEDYAVNEALPIASHGYGTAIAAIGSLEEALALVPTGVPIRYELAKLWDLVGNREKSIAHLRSVVEQLPEFTAARFFLAESLFNAGHFQQASDEYLQCLKQRPGLGDVQHRLAGIARINGAHDTGEDELRAFQTYSYPDFRGNETVPVTLEGKPLETAYVGPVTLVEEGYRGYNIVECIGVYYAVAQTLGPVVPDDVRVRVIEARFISRHRRLCKFIVRYIDKLPYSARCIVAELLGERLGGIASRMRRIARPILYARTREEAISAIDLFLERDLA